MNKKYLIIALVISTLLGSLVTFYACNFIFGDISNYAAGIENNTSLVDLPIVMLGAILVCLPFYLLRLYQRPKSIKRLSITYCLIVFVLAFLGFFGALLSGIVVYKSFTKPYPFPGYLILGMIIHLLILVGVSLVYFLLIRPLKEDEVKSKVTPKYVFYTIGMFLLVGLSYNRLGGLLLSPLFFTTSTWLLTIPSYLWLLVPIALLTIKAISIIYKPINLFIPFLMVSLVNIAIFIPVIILTLNNTFYVSSISPLMPLERLISMPIETILHFIILLIVSVVYTLKERKKCVRASKKT